ncbi:hypothetical protein FOZ63_002106 [Perkinsus olseni]|uniref:Uncharacterized protein n=1 Tax=Perkinsus olseni TaxID=32597 RepID=A0A7J6RSL5_PEROL|nr:hypothetical protein FOZ63_002106 [Perkinsus olseni]KAF4723493.1 hypothetical protein FOZ62_024725 [Perkinsus olseni]
MVQGHLLLVGLSLFYTPLALTSARGRKRRMGVSDDNGSRTPAKVLRHGETPEDEASWRSTSSSSLDDCLSDSSMSSDDSSKGHFGVTMLDKQRCHMFDKAFNWLYQVVDNLVYTTSLRCPGGDKSDLTYHFGDDHKLYQAAAHNQLLLEASLREDPLSSAHVTATAPRSDSDCSNAAEEVYRSLGGAEGARLVEDHVPEFTARLCSLYYKEIFGDTS